MTLKSDVKFEEKLTLGSKNEISRCFFRMPYFVFLGYLLSKLILLKVNQNIMIPNFKRIETNDEIFQIFGPVSIAVSDW